MPPTKSPPTLFEISLGVVHTLLLDTGKRILRDYGPFGSLRCELAVEGSCEFLSSHVVPPLLDRLLNSFPPHHKSELNLVLLAFLMNPSTKTCWPRFKLPIEANFYERKVAGMGRLVALNLAMVATDEILSVVGANCPSLEEINIVSKVESAAPKSVKGLNALKLKLFVSDEGLDSLHQCKKLKKIIMNQQLRSNCGGRKVTHRGISRLLRYLPHLYFINYSDMGLVLEGYTDAPSLNLTQLHDNHIAPSHIDIFDQMCPKLKHLGLKVPLASYNKDIAPSVIKKLTDSRLLLSALDLGFFPFDENLTKYLHLKGQHLSSFSISYGSTITAEKLVLLAVHCPNLKCLQVKVLHRTEDEHVPTLPHSHPYFKKLLKVQLIGVDWDPYLILPLCLNNAKSVTKLTVGNGNYIDPLDRLVLNLLLVNPLEDLEELSLHDGCNMSDCVFRSLLFSCKNLTKVTLSNRLGLIPVLQQLKAKYINFDVAFQTDDFLAPFKF